MRGNSGTNSLVRLAATLVLPLALIATAQGEEEDTGRRFDNVETRQRHAVGQACGKVLESVQQMTEEQAWSRAEQELNRAGGACTTSYEISQLQNFLGYVYYSQERYRDAINAYNRMLAEADVDERQAINTRYTIAQLYLILEDYPAAIRELERWMQESPIVGSDAKVLLAQAYYQVERYNDALRLVEEAIAEQEARGNLPKEAWWGLQRVIYYERSDYRRVVDILKKLIRHYPSYSYWRQLGGMYAELNQPINQLVANEAVYLAGDLNQERQLISMAYMFLGAEAPFLAARVLERGIKEGHIPRNGDNLEILGLAWQQGRDSRRALPVLEEAARLSGKGTLFERLAGVYLDLDENERAVTAARNALNRGGLRRADITRMNLGNALINLHCYDDAVQVFREAARDDRSARHANQWIEYAEREGRRRQQLIEAGAPIEGCKRV